MAKEDIGGGEWLDESYKKRRNIERHSSTKLPEDMTLQDMLKMPLNHHACGRDFTVMRVPGGWIYDGKQDTFIPEPT